MFHKLVTSLPKISKYSSSQLIPPLIQQRLILMNLSPYFYSVIAATVLASCTSSEIPPKSQSAPSRLKVVTVDEKTKIVMGQNIYVPVYSHIYYENQEKVFNLTVTLSIRNTDLNKPMIITSVRYYDSNGKVVKQFLARPVQLGAMASTDFVVARTDTSGGSGANFIVEWIAETEIFEPVVEAVMIGTESNRGISFISPGKVIKSQRSSERDLQQLR